MQMMIDYLFGAASFVPHGYCLLWRPDLVAMHAVSDLLTATAYFSIPVAIFVFQKKRRDLAFPWVFRLFAAFIFLCGATHLVGFWTIWQPVYGFEGLVKVAMAVVSVATATILWPVLPRLLALPSPAMLQLANDQLADEVALRRQTEADLREALDRLQQHIVNTPLGVIELRYASNTLEDGKISLWTGQARKIFGWTAEEAVGRSSAEIGLVHEADEGKHALALEDLAFGGVSSRVSTIRCYTKSHEIRHCRCHASVVQEASNDTATVLILVEDITESVQANEQIHRLAHHDLVTGLPNRLLFGDRLAQALARARRDGSKGALMMLDLDHFKEVNDTLGHAAGDQLLKEVGRRLASVTRETDTLARLGGDEFALLHTGFKESATAGLLADRLLRALVPPVPLDGQEALVSSSIGVTVFPDDGDSVTTLMRNADIALYRAKALGRGTAAHYHPTMDHEAQSRSSLQRLIREALETDRFDVAYQPIVELESGREVQREALLRLDHPAGGPIHPAALIQVAEQSGLIQTLGAWMIERACRDAARWRGTGAVSSIAVNLSVAQLRSKDLVPMVESALAAHALDAALLELEITESIFLDPSATAIISALDELTRMGVRLAIDDFGTGYSSLGYLKNFPFHTIKLDASFVREIGRDPGSESIVLAILALGRSLGKQVVAEGIETDAQRRYLQANGCPLGQGYLFGRPRVLSQARG